MNQLRITNLYGPALPTPPEKCGILGVCDISRPFRPPQWWRHLLTPEEVQYVIQQSEQKFRPSTMVSGTDTKVRKSQTAILTGDDPTIHNILDRIAIRLQIPVQHIEPIQIAKYEPGDYYTNHYDPCSEENDYCRKFVETGGQRMATVVVYLNDDFQGGETDFPLLKQKFRGNPGDGLLFYSLDDRGKEATFKTHPLAIHAGLPVTTGVKYIANIWIRQGKYIVPLTNKSNK